MKTCLTPPFRARAVYQVHDGKTFTIAVIEAPDHMPFAAIYDPGEKNDRHKDAILALAAKMAACDELFAELETAVLRVGLANAEGDPILSAWLPGATRALAKARLVPDYDPSA